MVIRLLVSHDAGGSKFRLVDTLDQNTLFVAASYAYQKFLGFNVLMLSFFLEFFVCGSYEMFSLVANKLTSWSVYSVWLTGVLRGLLSCYVSFYIFQTEVSLYMLQPSISVSI